MLSAIWRSTTTATNLTGSNIANIIHGAAAAIQFATLSPGLALAAGEFVVV